MAAEVTCPGASPFLTIDIGLTCEKGFPCCCVNPVNWSGLVFWLFVIAVFWIFENNSGLNSILELYSWLPLPLFDHRDVTFLVGSWLIFRVLLGMKWFVWTDYVFLLLKISVFNPWRSARLSGLETADRKGFSTLFVTFTSLSVFDSNYLFSTL